MYILSASLAVKELAHQVLRDLLLPFVSVGKKLFLIVQEFFVGLGRKFVVGTLNDGIHGTRLLAESAINALGHVDVVPSGAAGSVFAGFGLDGDGLGGADCLAEFARDAALVSRGVSSQGVLATEPGTQVPPLERVVDRHLVFQTDFEGERKSACYLGQEENFGGSVEDCFPRSGKNIIVVDIGILSCRGTRCGG